MSRLAGSRPFPRRSLLAALPAAFLLSSVPGRAAEPPAGPRADGALRVPILLYHRFGPVLTDEMTVTTPVFEGQLGVMRERGYGVAPLRTLLAALGGTPDGTGGEALQRSVVLTVDDGHRTVYSDLFPLLLRYRLPATLFIYPTAISNADYAMTWAQLAEMKASGLVDVQSHTFWHPNFNVERKRLSPAAYRQFVHDQLAKSKSILEQRLGGTVDLLAWPFGIYDEELMQAARDAGYTAAFSIERRPVTAKDNVMALPRYIVVDADRGNRFEALMAGQR
ncbi:MAG: polysaccharide deacetylase family protein [Proteobacteria bacterium]|nr:polysaccharide deacetylase family protein [Pseudomonadota bacterium]